MPDAILHHYAVSPFAEKIRAMLGYKGLAWRSVDIPMVMPKPDLTALTGGYRKTPVLQIGCDVYCDTTLIARLLDALSPERPVYCPEQDGMAVPAGRWLDHHLFFSVIAQLFDPAAAAASQDMLGGPEGAVAFAKDRGPMLAAARVKPPPVSKARVILDDVLRSLDAQLGARGPFLFGEAVGWADFCAYHPLWAMRANAVLAPRLDAHPHLGPWLDRIRAFGHGEPTPLGSLEAPRSRDRARRGAVPATGIPSSRRSRSARWWRSRRTTMPSSQCRPPRPLRTDGPPSSEPTNAPARSWCTSCGSASGLSDTTAAATSWDCISADTALQKPRRAEALRRLVALVGRRSGRPGDAAGGALRLGVAPRRRHFVVRVSGSILRRPTFPLQVCVKAGVSRTSSREGEPGSGPSSGSPGLPLEGSGRKVRAVAGLIAACVPDGGWL